MKNFLSRILMEQFCQEAFINSFSVAEPPEMSSVKTFDDAADMQNQAHITSGICRYRPPSAVGLSFYVDKMSI